jgi:hypothetical protein
MKTFYLKKQYEENFIEITKWLDELWETEWEIYIDDGGWYIWVADAILSRINKMKIILKSHLLVSSWFYLFYFFKWNKELIKWSEAIIHAITMVTDIFFDNKWNIKVKNDELFLERLKDTWMPKEYSLFLTNEEIDLIYDWKDVLLNEERLLKIFDNMK